MKSLITMMKTDCNQEACMSLRGAWGPPSAAPRALSQGSEGRSDPPEDPPPPLSPPSPPLSSDLAHIPHHFPQDLTLSVGSVQGRIKVYVRPRPFDEASLEARGGNAVTVGGMESDEVTVVDDKGRESTFGFDHVFNTAASNGSVFEAVGRPVVKSVLCGYNGTLMAYGQTGTGKTHTLGASDGLIPEMLKYLFTTIAKEAAPPAESADLDGDAPEPDWSVIISYVQVYMEKVYDLLHPVESDRALALRERFDTSNNESSIYIENVTEHRVGSAAEALTLIECGRKRLHFAETKMNRHSSRSHACCLVSVERVVKKGRGRGKALLPSASRVPAPVAEESEVLCASFSGLAEEDAQAEEAKTQLELERALAQEQGEVSVRARLTMVDLAGSERVKKTGAEGSTLAEAQKINLSLLELGNTIQALAIAGGRNVPGRHIPFRNSTLTRLLQESLGGNCKTSLIVCISPCSSDSSETKSALQFGSRAIQIKNTAVINCERDYKALAESLAQKLEEGEAKWLKQRSLMENQLATANEELSSLKQSHAAEVAGLRACVEALRAEMELMDEEFERRDARVWEMQVDFQEQMSAEIARQAEQGRAMEDELRAALLGEKTEKEFALLQGKEAHAMECLEAEIAQQAALIQSLRKELAAAASEKESLLERLSPDVEAEQAALIASLREELATAASEREALLERLSPTAEAEQAALIDSLRQELVAAASEKEALLEQLCTDAEVAVPDPSEEAQQTEARTMQEEQDPHPASVVRSVLCEELARLDNETAKLSEVREEDEAARLASLADEAARVSRLEKENASLRSELAASEKEQSSLLAKLADAHALASSGNGISDGATIDGSEKRNGNMAGSHSSDTRLPAAHAVITSDKATQTLELRKYTPRRRCFGLCPPSSKVEPEHDVSEPQPVKS